MTTTVLRPSRKGMNDRSLMLQRPRNVRNRRAAINASRGLDTLLERRESYNPGRYIASPHENEVRKLVRQLLSKTEDPYADVSHIVSHARTISKQWGWIS